MNEYSNKDTVSVFVLNALTFACDSLYNLWCALYSSNMNFKHEWSYMISITM